MEEKKREKRKQASDRMLSHWLYVVYFLIYDPYYLYVFFCPPVKKKLYAHSECVRDKNKKNQGETV
jgi:hypothetical protein